MIQGLRRRHAERVEHAAGLLLRSGAACRRETPERRRGAHHPAPAPQPGRASRATRGSHRRTIPACGSRRCRASASSSAKLRHAARRRTRAACRACRLRSAVRWRLAAGTAPSCRRPPARDRSGRTRAGRSARRCRSPSLPGQREIGEPRCADLDVLLRERCDRPRGVGATTSTPSVPSRSTTLAAPPPVVVMTATRCRCEGLLAAQSAGSSNRFSSVSTRRMPCARKKASAISSRARHRAGMRCGEILPDFRAAELVDDHLLARCVRAPRGVRELVRVAQRFHEEQDRPRVRIVDEQIGELAHAQGPIRCRRRSAWRSRRRGRGRATSARRACCRSARRSRAALHDLRHFEHGVDGDRAAGIGLTRPMQFGPIRRTPPARAVSRIVSCVRRPSAPVSAKPSL